MNRLLQETSSRELSEWMAFDRVEPIGDRRRDLQAGIVASVMANAYRDRKKRPKPYSPTDFIPDYWQQPVEQSWEQQLYIVEILNLAFGGRDLRDHGNDRDADNPNRG